MVISASFCIMGASRRSRAHLSFSRGELGCARGISAHQALPWHGVTVGLGVQQGCPWTRVLGHIPFSKEEKSNSTQDARKDRMEGVLHVHTAGAELALPPLGAKNTLLRHLTVMPEQSWGDSLAWGHGSGAGQGKTGRNNQFLFPPRSHNALGWMGH